MTDGVVVVGAGVAGMTAALELVDAGLDVTVVEARRRVGGRVLTLRAPFDGGMHVEAGARYVLGDHANVIALARRLGVHLDPLPAPQATRHVFYARGRRVLVEDGETADLPFAIRDDERGRIDSNYIAPALADLGDPRDPGWPSPEVAALDELTFHELLARRRASPEAIALTAITPLERTGDGGAHASALAVLRRERLARAGSALGVTVIRGGTDTLAEALAKRLGDRIQLGWAASAIERDERGVTVHTTCAGEPRPFRGADAVLAMPAPLLRALDFTPRLSPGKAAALESVESTSVVRVFLQTRDAPWLRASCEAGALTDLPIGQLFEAARAADGRCVLESYATGAAARSLGKLDPGARVALALAYAERVHPGMAASFERGTSWSWDDDPWARGAFPWFRPRALTRHRAWWSEPEGRLHFAGDQASIMPGWMEGAIRSGRDAARAIIERRSGARTSPCRDSRP